jgi:hypothetical protein
MTDATDATKEFLRVAFNRWLNLEFRRARITLDSRQLAHRKLDDALGMRMMGVSALSQGKRRMNTGTGCSAALTYGRLASYEDVDDAARLQRMEKVCKR